MPAAPLAEYMTMESSRTRFYARAAPNAREKTARGLLLGAGTGKIASKTANGPGIRHCAAWYNETPLDALREMEHRM
jgi:hypothetical protein